MPHGGMMNAVISRSIPNVTVLKPLGQQTYCSGDIMAI